MPETLAGRRALITGAGSGIGKACAQLLAQRGAAVGALDLRGDAVTEVVNGFASTCPGRVGLQCDVTEEQSVAAAVEGVVAALGGLDVVIAAAGITKPAHTHMQPLEEWSEVIAVNLTGMFLTLKHSLPHLISSGGGAIVTIGSTASLVAAGRSASYDASKGGVLQLTRTVAVEYAAQHIRANCVCPGWISTSLVQNSQELYGWADGLDPPAVSRIRAPIERSADPREVAAVAAFLCSDESSFVTGVAVPVDGGYTAI